MGGRARGREGRGEWPTTKRVVRPSSVHHRIVSSDQASRTHGYPPLTSLGKPWPKGHNRIALAAQCEQLRVLDTLIVVAGTVSVVAETVTVSATTRTVSATTKTVSATNTILFHQNINIARRQPTSLD